LVKAPQEQKRILYVSAARAGSLCLSVLADGVEHMRVDGETGSVIIRPPPPRELRS
jgi:hypothetical protein